MNYKIETIPRFEKDVKTLKKKFPKIKNDLEEFINELSSSPQLGTNVGDNEKRSNRASKESFLEALSKVPSVEPDERDRL